MKSKDIRGYFSARSSVPVNIRLEPATLICGTTPATPGDPDDGDAPQSVQLNWSDRDALNGSHHGDEPCEHRPGDVAAAAPVAQSTIQCATPDSDNSSPSSRSYSHSGSDSDAPGSDLDKACEHRPGNALAPTTGYKLDVTCDCSRCYFDTHRFLHDYSNSTSSKRSYT